MKKEERDEKKQGIFFSLMLWFSTAGHMLKTAGWKDRALKGDTQKSYRTGSKSNKKKGIEED